MKKLLLFGMCVVVMSCNSLTDTDEVGPYPCDVYCNIMFENCNETYSGDLDACYDACAEFPDQPETNESGGLKALGDRVGNADSIECRVYHAETANESGRPANNGHCKEAAPTGGGTCSNAPQPCATLCFNLFDVCSDPDERATEDYFACENACVRDFDTIKDSSEFLCRVEASIEAALAKDEGRVTQRIAQCSRAQGGLGESSCERTDVPDIAN